MKDPQEVDHNEAFELLGVSGQERRSSAIAEEVPKTGRLCFPCCNMAPPEQRGGLFRSEPMSRCQLILQSEAAYNCISELGELGLVQFVDLNPEVSSFQRKFVGEIKRCEEMERKLRYIHKEAMRDSVSLVEPGDNPSAPAPREMTELETALNNLERDLSDVNTNYVALKKNQLELLEMKNLLTKTEIFLSETTLQLAESDGADESRNSDDSHLIDLPDEHMRGMKFHMTAGIIVRQKMASFEKLLWRVSKGNVFVRFADITDSMEDPATGDIIPKSVFIIFYQGEQLKSRVRKICEGYHATTYPCPDKASERREMMYGVATRLEDLATVLHQTEEHRNRLIRTGADNLRTWYTKVRKIKAIYHCLNLFSFDVTQKALVAECWMPEYDIPFIQEALGRGAEKSGSTIPPILNAVSSAQDPPTFNRLNKFTRGFQNLVDAFAVNSYREVNPGIYTIATFPFLFAVMFGDAGHGLIVLLAGIAMILLEKRLEKSAGESEIFNIFFGGRYIITMMGFFSVYTGLIYNDVFSKSFNIFGSHWAWRDNATFPLKMEEMVMLDPGNFSQYRGDPYYMGIDPVWMGASNKISFLNGYKMKISLIFGLIHMMFGLMLSLWNKLIKKNYPDILLEFVPQVIFLLFIFCYLIFLIFFKWSHYYADTVNKDTNIYSEHCAPNLLITFINMMLFKEATPDPKLVEICQGRETYMFYGQGTLQKFLVIIGVLMVPVMLFGKPLHTVIGRRRRRRNYEAMVDEEVPISSAVDGGYGDIDAEVVTQQPGSGSGPGEEGEMAFSEIMIYQGIHTIEYVLGSVSHTASYLRLWALSLAHSQLSEVLWQMVMSIPFTSFPGSYVGAVAIYLIFAAWAFLTVSILVVMEGLSAFLHTLRLHWVEFQSKFYKGEGVLFVPFNFADCLKEAEASDKEVLKS